MMTIGILDSGLGGYSVYDALRVAYPKSSFLFLADQLHAPYGDKSKEEIFGYVKDALKWFKTQQITEILVACNTICSLVLEDIIPHFPELTISGIIDPTIAQLNGCSYKNVLVVATQGTIHSQVYTTKLKRLKPELQVIGKALPQLVVQLERLAPLSETEVYLEETLSEYKNKVDAVILGCTHYPLVKPIFERLFNVPVYDSREPIVALFSNRKLSSGPCKIFTTKDPAYLAYKIKVLFDSEENVELAQVTHADRCC